MRRYEALQVRCLELCKREFAFSVLVEYFNKPQDRAILFHTQNSLVLVRNRLRETELDYRLAE